MKVLSFMLVSLSARLASPLLGVGVGVGGVWKLTHGTCTIYDIHGVELHWLLCTAIITNPVP